MRILQSRILFHEKNRRNIPMQKIAFHLNSLQQGGAERVVSNLANRFAKEGYEVVIATEWYGTDEFALDQKVRRVHVGLTKEDENRSRISKMLRRIWYLRRFMKKEKPDVVVAFTRGVLYRALAAGIGTGIPVVISVRTDPVGHYDKKRTSFGSRFCFLMRRAACSRQRAQKPFLHRIYRKIPELF